MATGGIKAIENIRIGDMVKSFNPATGKTENKRVLQTFENTTDELIHVFTSDGAKVSSTLSHPFYANNSWTSAKDLRAGDILVNVNGQKVVVEKIQHEILETPVKVYNFEVSGNHTYFVGDGGGIAVHNKNCHKSNSQAKVKKQLTPNELGKKGEEAAAKYLNATKNTKTYAGKINEKRIPDFVLDKKIVEVKNVKSQSFTGQIKDSIYIAGYENKQFELIVDINTRLSKPLKEGIEKAGGIITRIVMR